MSVSGISAVPTTSFQSSQSGFRQEFGQLVSSLNSGDLSGAGQAYATLSQLQSSGQGPSTNPNSPVSQALAQIGQALQSGDLGAAQQALSSLQQSHGGHHHHGHHGGSAGASAVTSTSTPTSSPSGNALNVTA
jgi:hypothetical protein